METNNEENNYRDLLNHLRCVVEGLLGCNPNNIWDVYGGFQRLHTAVIQILKHGFRFFKDNGEPDFWIFIQGLSWLQPALAASPSFLNHSSSSTRSPLRHADKALTWLYKSIESHTLSEKLSWLLSDHEHLLSCYKVNAYIRQVQYSEATLICLRSVEQRQVSLLAKIDPSLYLKKKVISTLKHRRCLSYPEPKSFDETVINSKQENSKKNSVSSNCNIAKVTDSPAPEKIVRVAGSNTRVVNSIFKNSEKEKLKKNVIRNCFLKNSFSTSDLYLLHQKEAQRFSYLKEDKPLRRRRSFSTSSHSHSEDYLSGGDDKHWLSDLIEINYNQPNDIANNKRISSSSIKKTDSSDSLLSISSTDTIINRDKTPRHKKKRRSTSFFRLPFRIWEASDDEKSVGSDDSRTLVPVNVVETSKRKSFIENGGNIILPMSIGSFPKPSPGQSIMSFLMSGVFTQTNAELDRENAHFHISEALIAALEQVKCNQQLKMTEDILEESDEEINNLKRIIRIRRLQKEKEHCLKESNEFFSTDTTVTTDQSVNSLTSSMYSTSESISTDQEDNHENRNLLSTARSGLSVSNLSLGSNDNNSLDCEFNSNTTAESVAISLISRFKENQLPAASEIEWLVSEQDAPQRILPLPNTLFSKEEANGDSAEVTGLLRGTSEWAPPRPQIIFTLHPPPIRRQIMEKQAFRCAGCGMKVAARYASKFRYCEYLGRYFCTGCHNDQTAIIPGRVLMKWDFTRYPVSNFSYRLLDQLAEDPLFNIMDLNSNLYHRARGLQKIRSLRFTLFYLKDFIFTCKYTEKLQKLIKSEASHIYTDPDCYSLADFIRVKNNKLYKSLIDIVKHCERHTAQCQLCQARGFMCEICTKPDVIFPWKLSTVIRCDKCGSCHHMKCFKRKPVCPKCARITNRNNLHQICGQRGILSS